MTKWSPWSVIVCLLVYSPAWAQGVQTGRLTGTVITADGYSVPTATVTATSPALQGERTATSDEHGNYLINGLPPGLYHISIEREGMTPVAYEDVTLPLGGGVQLDTTMVLGTFQATITVVASLPNPVTATEVSTNFLADEIDKLPRARTPVAIAELAPGLTINTPDTNQLTISGAFAFDNVVLVDGVDVDDNLFAQPEFLFVEDAIKETQVLTSGVSAEYGRFAGGVVNIITKSGGNVFSGSFRELLTNPSWTNESPYEVEREITRDDTLNLFHEGTFGGPIVKDRVWFFVAGRYFDASTSDVFPQSGIPVTRALKNKRGQVKVTATVAPGQTLQGNFVSNSTVDTGTAFVFSVDPATLRTRRLPNTLLVTGYRGVVRSSMFLEAQYSEKRFGFRDSGGTSKNIYDSPFRTVGVSLPFGLHYHAPFFDATDPEDRNNRQLTGSLSYMWTASRLGTHDTKTGGEHFVATSKGGNSASSTGYVFFSDYQTNARGEPVLDANGQFIPLFLNGRSALQTHLASRGESFSVRTASLYFTDRWTLDNHWSFNLGLRFEDGQSDGADGLQTLNSSRLLPRLGAAYDVTGDGRTTLGVSYGHYGGKATERLFGFSDPARNPGLVAGFYAGPSGSGNDFAAGFNPANYQTFAGSFPTANITYADDVTTALTRELTVSVGSTLRQKGSAWITYTRRTMSNFLEDLVSIENGSTTIIRDGLNFGTFDNSVVENSDTPRRDYQALQFAGRYSLSNRWFVNGYWTVQAQNDGDYEGEFQGFPGAPSCIGNYPEMLVPARSCAAGKFDDFQRHKIRVWSIYDWSLGRYGDTSVAVLYRYDSGLTYSLTAGDVPLSAIQLAADPGYASPPRTQFVFFGERGAEGFPGNYGIDLNLIYRLPVWKAQPYLEFEAFNIFDNDKLTSFNTLVSANTNGPVDEHGIPTTYVKGQNFGQATGIRSFPLGRTFQVSFGLRF